VGAGGADRTPGPVERARALAPLIEAHAAATEAAGQVVAPVAAALHDAELFWLMTPVELGGWGADALTSIGVFEELARADGSTGWSFMANSLETGFAAAFCGEEALKTIFGGAVRPIMCGMFGPGGRCVEVDGGFEGSGHYSYASGAAQATWFCAGMHVLEDGVPRKLPTGDPEVRIMLVPRERTDVEGNWDTFGMVGTGSWDYAIPQQFVPAEMTFERTTIEPLRGGPLHGMGVLGWSCAGHIGVALGLMRRALEEIVPIATAKRRPAYPGPLGDSHVFRADFAWHEGSYQAARAFVWDVYGATQDQLLAGRPLDATHRARFRQAATYVHRVGADVVRFCYTWGGSEALRNPNPLGRVMRDMYTATQHVYVDPMNFVDAAPVLMEQWGKGSAP
jgi:alkylation response protein AidB-like acyl-CoA dehydrogenase